MVNRCTLIVEVYQMTGTTLALWILSSCVIKGMPMQTRVCFSQQLSGYWRQPWITSEMPMQNVGISNVLTHKSRSPNPDHIS